MQIKDRFRGFLPVIIDVETAGFNAETDALLQVAAVTLKLDNQNNFKIHSSESFNIRPFDGANIEPKALEFNSIKNPFDENRNLYSEKDALKALFQPIRQQVKLYGCSRAVMVAHNAHFDLTFINAACKRQNYKRNPFHPFSCFDTVSLAGLAYGQTVLSRACQIAGLGFDNSQAHNALYDAEKTAQLFCVITNQWKLENKY